MAEINDERQSQVETPVGPEAEALASIEAARQRLSEIDDEIRRLFDERFAIATQEIEPAKAVLKLPVPDSTQATKVIQDWIDWSESIGAGREFGRDIGTGVVGETERRQYQARHGGRLGRAGTTRTVELAGISS